MLVFFIPWHCFATASPPHLHHISTISPQHHHHISTISPPPHRISTAPPPTTSPHSAWISLATKKLCVRVLHSVAPHRHRIATAPPPRRHRIATASPPHRHRITTATPPPATKPPTNSPHSSWFGLANTQIHKNVGRRCGTIAHATTRLSQLLGGSVLPLRSEATPLSQLLHQHHALPMSVHHGVYPVMRSSMCFAHGGVHHGVYPVMRSSMCKAHGGVHNFATRLLVPLSGITEARNDVSPF